MDKDSRRVSVPGLVLLAIIVIFVATNFLRSFSADVLQHATPYFFASAAVTAAMFIGGLWVTGQTRSFFEPKETVSRYAWLGLIPGIAALAAFLGRQSPEIQFVSLGIWAGAVAGLLISWMLGAWVSRH